MPQLTLAWPRNATLHHSHTAMAMATTQHARSWSSSSSSLPPLPPPPPGGADAFTASLQRRTEMEVQALLQTAAAERGGAPRGENIEDDEREELLPDEAGGGAAVNPETGEVYGPRGKEPTRYGDWEVKGRATDFS